MKKIILTILLFPAIIQAQFQAHYSQFEKKALITVDSTKSHYSLPDSFLIHQSEKVICDTILLVRDRDYQIDYIKGQISFFKKLPHGTQISLFYRFYPLSLQQQYFRRQRLIYQPEEQFIKPAPIVKTRKQKSASTASTLKQNGSIIRGISIGSNQGMKLESGLRMQISGKIADKVEVVAALTDQNTPIQPEGNTQTLQEIDKVFVRIKSEQIQATLGDYYFSLEGTEFSPYQRKLQGVMASAKAGNSEITISGAVSKGKFITNYFLGQEGNQGPYQLKGERGQIDIIVLAGTEKVWIDGEPMTRGEDRDYVIEYSNGQITFTRNRLITADSRITVDFQYTDLKFQRSLYSADLKTRMLNNKLDIGVRLLRESDNKDNPLDFSLNDDIKNRLRTAGDEIDSAYVSGVHYVGDGNGSYVAIDSAGIKFYRYVGTGSGDYNVAFNYFGSGKGDYKLVSYNHYEYVGAGNGSYLPLVLLTPAESHDLLDLSLNFHPISTINMITEIAMSRKDNNLYSPKDDQDNIGFASTSYFQFNSNRVSFFGKNLGKFNLRGKFRRVQERFRYLSRTEEIEKNRKWDIPDATINAEKIFEINSSYSPIQSVKFSGNWGENSKGENFQSKRWQAATEFRLKRLPEIRYRIEEIISRNRQTNRKGDWIRQHGFSSYRFHKTKSTFEFSAEQKKENYSDSLYLGLRYYQISPKIELIDWHKMTFSAKLTQRNQDKYTTTGFFPESEARTHQFNWQFKGSKYFALSMRYTHRQRTYADSSIGTKLTDLADFRAQFSPFRRAISTNWHYQLSNTQVAKQEKIYLKVERGQGNYRYDEELNEYIPDALNGDYILRIRATDEFIPVVELRASSTIKIQPSQLLRAQKPGKKLTGWRKWLTSLSSETFLRLEEKTQDENVWAIYRLELSRFQQETTTIYGLKNIRQDFYWNRNRSTLSIRLRYNKKTNLNNQYLEGGQRFDYTENSVRIKGKILKKMSAQLDAMRKLEIKKYQIAGRNDKDILTGEIAVDLSYRPQQRIEIAARTKWLNSENRAGYPIKVDLFSVSPRINYSFRRKGKLRAEVEFNHVKVVPENAILPYEMASGYHGGTNVRWLASFDYNVSRYIRASVSWNGRYEAYLKKPIYTLRAEMRAYF